MFSSCISLRMPTEAGRAAGETVVVSWLRFGGHSRICKCGFRLLRNYSLARDRRLDVGPSV